MTSLQHVSTLADAPHIGAPALGALVVALIWGVLLLCFGAALLRPMVVLAAVITGVLVGVVVARAWVPEVPLWLAAAAGGVAGLIAGSLLYRPAVASMSACVGATVGAMVAWAVIAGGALDTAPRESDHALVASLRESAIPGDGARSSQALLEILMAAPAETAGSDAGNSAATAGDRVLRDLSELATRAADSTRASLASTGPAYRTLLYGSIATGAVIGFIAGLLATTLVARILTSFAGAGLVLVSGVPLLALWGYAPLPSDARPWLAALASLALLGILAQSLMPGSKGSSKKSSPRPARAAPAAAA